MLGLMMSVSGCSKKKTVTPQPPDNVRVVTPPDDKVGPTDIRPPEAGVKPEGFDQNVKTIYFDFDRSDIRADQVSRLEGNANYLKENKELKILIEGHCDEQGSAEYNFALGQRRASSVREFLISRGVAADRLSIVSKGEEEPAVEGHDAAAWSMNRRSAFKVTFKVTN
jgi:peptidoglycan-associated lipoprotein